MKSLTAAALVASFGTASRAAIVAAIGGPTGALTRADAFPWVGYAINTRGPMGGPSVTFVTSTLGSITTVTATASAPFFEQLFIRAAVSQLL